VLGSALPAGAPLAEAAASLRSFVIGAAILFGLMLLLAALRKRLLRDREINSSVTWDCGYAQPSARMQYTASSFAQPLTDLFGSILRTSRHSVPPHGLFPQTASLATETSDLSRENLFRPAFNSIAWGLSKLRWLQTGNAHLYILYIALTLIVLLGWKLA